MSDGACPSEPAAHQRAVGHLRLQMRRRGAATVLARLRQEGCLKARFPHVDPGGWAEAVTLNSSGGIAGGDRLSSDISLEPGAELAVASQAAERVYRALPDAVPAQIRTRIDVADGAYAEWLPQETILFDGCAVDRTLTIELAENASLLAVESLMFGRAAMGERVITARCRDRVVICRNNRLLLHDVIRFDGEVASRLGRPAIAAGARAVATLFHAAPGLGAAQLDAVRAALAGFEAGASLWNGLLIARILAPDQMQLRSAVVAGLHSLRAGRKLPRVWLC